MTRLPQQIALFATVFASGALAQDKADIIKQDAAAAVQADIDLAAYGKQVDPDQVAKAIAFQEKFTEYARALEDRYPGQLSRVYLEPVPAIGGHIQFVGDVPLKRVHLAGVQVTGHGQLSRAQHARRAELAADALKAAGHTNFYTHFDSRRGTIRVEMAVPSRAQMPDHDKVQDLIDEAIFDGEKSAALASVPVEIDFVVDRRDGPIYELEWSRGGLWCRDGGNDECTSGWAVSGPNGNGIITAGHCTGLDSIGGSDHAMTFRRQEQDKGDVEYHTTAGVEVAEFWASSSDLRDVESTKETVWMLPGNSVCVYGRSSNVRGCAHDIEATGVTVVGDNGITYRKMVRASGDSTIPGDSGGGWSWGTKAWGVHSGSNNVDSFFTPVGRAERELDVDILTQ